MIPRNVRSIASYASKSLAVLLPLLVPAPSAALEAGASAVDITPAFEGRPLATGRKNKGYKRGDPFFDTGVDGRFDFEESGALGADGAPGRAGVDDDGNGLMDDCTRESCGEYLAAGSDDVRDPAGDNYHRRRNRRGTEGDRKFQFLHLGGFSPYYPAFVPNRIAAGVNDPIWARALALRGDDGAPLLLISTDLPGLGWKHINPVRRRLAREFGVPMGSIIIASTHVHSAPDAIGYWTSLLKGRNRWYTDWLREKMYEAGSAAFRALRPAAMRTVTTRHYACRDELTGELKKDPDCRIPALKAEYRREGWQSRWDAQIVQHDKRDPIVRNTNIVAAQFSALDGSGTIATFVNWHNHPDSLMSDNMLVSSDYVHYLREYVEAELGGVAVYFTGTLGCQIGSSRGLPVPAWTSDRRRILDEQGRPALFTTGWERIRSLGYEVGHEAVAALRSATPAPGAAVSVRTETLWLKVDNFLHNLATGPVWRDGVTDPADRMRRFRRGCWSAHGCVPGDLSVARVGDLGIVTAPGEVDPSYLLGRAAVDADYGKAGRWRFPAMPGWNAHMPGTHHAVLGQANNYLSYLIHRADYVGWWNHKHPNHYEDLVTINPDFGDTVGNHLLKMLGSRERFEGKAVEGGPSLGELATGGPDWLVEQTLRGMTARD